MKLYKAFRKTTAELIKNGEIPSEKDLSVGSKQKKSAVWTKEDIEKAEIKVTHLWNLLRFRKCNCPICNSKLEKN